MSAVRPQEAVERALQAAAAIPGVSGCIVIADEASDANLRWANNTLTTNGVTRGSSLTVIATVGAGSGTAAGTVSHSAVAAAEIGDLVDAAVHAARENPAAEDAAPLIEPGDSSSGASSGTSWDHPVPATSGAVFGSFAGSLATAFEQARAREQLLFGYAEHSLGSTFLGSSTGLRLRHDQPTGRVEMNAKSTDLARSAWTGVPTRDFTDVDATAVGDQLAVRLGWAARRVDLPAGRYETIVPPSAVADLLIYMYWSSGARDAHDGQNVFSKPGGGTRVGEKLAALPVTLMSDPGYPGLETTPFVVARASSREQSVFDNGLPLGATSWIDGGVLRSLVQTRFSAGLTDLPVTPDIGNLVLRGDADDHSIGDGGRSLDDMVANTQRGLLLTCLWYIRAVDPQTLLLTGLTRDGVYLVEDGEVTGAVNNFRFNESPVDLLGRLSEVGAPQRCMPREWSDYFTRTIMPPIRVPDFNMSTVSKAS